MNLFQTGLAKLYKEIEPLGDPLTGISDRIDFKRNRPILADLFSNDTEKGGRPHYDTVLMVKILLLQHGTISQILRWKERSVTGYPS